MTLKGKIAPEKIAYLKFGISGMVRQIKVKTGDTVKSGQLLASLDKTEAQTFLDKTLKLYDMQRAEFDEKQKEKLTEYQKRKFQDELDITVKVVELAKIDLDKTDLYSSIDGVVAEISPVNPNENITPAGFVITVVDTNGYAFEAVAQEAEATRIRTGQRAAISLTAYPDRNLFGTVKRTDLLPEKELYRVVIGLDDKNGLMSGLTGRVELG